MNQVYTYTIQVYLIIALNFYVFILHKLHLLDSASTSLTINALYLCLNCSHLSFELHYINWPVISPHWLRYTEVVNLFFNFFWTSIQKTLVSLIWWLHIGPHQSSFDTEEGKEKLKKKLLTGAVILLPNTYNEM